MAKTTKKTSKSKKIAKMSDYGTVYYASAILFAGSVIVLLGALQNFDNLTLVMVGLGSALLVVGGSMLGFAAKTTK